MSIKVKNLVKSYGTQTVLNNISFEAGSGEILGFLGPNGAGKTTTMKIITGYTMADSGLVELCGQDIKIDPIHSKTQIGYLPEHNPLYTSMYVKEFLTFSAALHKINKPEARINELIEKTGLEKEQHKQIRMLSKGYRQRVGLAQALLHDPEVLILDEPTSGLDPNQLEDIRNVIREIGKEKTLLFSSHIMQEVQALCDRVLIINNGEIVANDSIENLEKYISAGHERVFVEFLQKIDTRQLEKLNGFIAMEQLGDFSYQVDCRSELEMRKAIFGLAVKNDYDLITLQKQDVGIENIFQALTK